MLSAEEAIQALPPSEGALLGQVRVQGEPVPLGGSWR